MAKTNTLKVCFLCLHRILPNSFALKTEALTQMPSTVRQMMPSNMCTSQSWTTCLSPAQAPKGQCMCAQNLGSRARHETQNHRKTHPGHWDAIKSQKVAHSHLLRVYLQLTQNASPPSVHFKDSGSHPINYYLSNLHYKHDSNFRLKIGL